MNLYWTNLNDVQETLSYRRGSTYSPLTVASQAAPPAGMVYRSYYFANGRRVAERVEGDPIPGNNGVFFFLKNHLGSITVTLKRNSDGSLTKAAELRYMPRVRTGPAATRRMILIPTTATRINNGKYWAVSLRRSRI